MSERPGGEGDAPAVGGIRIASAGTACDNDRCSVLVYNPTGPRRFGQPVSGCPGCGEDGFDVRFGIGLDTMRVTGSVGCAQTRPTPPGSSTQPDEGEA